MTTDNMKKPKPNAADRALPGQRQLRVAEQIRHLLAEILQRETFHDPALLNTNVITVTSVEIGRDLKHATAFVMPLGGKNADKFLEAMNRAAGFFRGALASRLNLRYTPKVTFMLDHSFDKADQIEKLIRQENVQRDLVKKD